MGIASLLVFAGARTSEAQTQERSLDRETYRQGRQHYSQKEYEAAIEDFQRAYDSYAHPILMFNIAASHMKAGDLRAALEASRRVQTQYRSGRTFEPRVTPGLIAQNDGLERASAMVLRAREYARTAPPPSSVSSPRASNASIRPSGWVGIGLGATGVGLLAGSFALNIDVGDELSRLKRVGRTRQNGAIRSRLRSKQRWGRGLLYTGSTLAAAGATVALFDQFSRGTSGAAPSHPGSMTWLGVASAATGTSLLAGSLGVALALEDDLQRADRSPLGSSSRSRVRTRQRIGRALLYSGSTLVAAGGTLALVDWMMSRERPASSRISWHPFVVEKGGGITLEFTRSP